MREAGGVMWKKHRTLTKNIIINQFLDSVVVPGVSATKQLMVTTLNGNDIRYYNDDNTTESQDNDTNNEVMAMATMPGTILMT